MTWEKANKLSQLCNSPTEKPQERSWGWGQHVESSSCSLQVWDAGPLLSWRALPFSLADPQPTALPSGLETPSRCHEFGAS